MNGSLAKGRRITRHVGVIVASLVALAGVGIGVCPERLCAQDDVLAWEGIGESCPGCWRCRDFLTGDWCGKRDALAAHGITFQGDVTQYYQGVANGGLRENFEYGGHADYVVNMDLDKLRGWQGAFLKVRGESQFGTFINNDTGALLAGANEGLLPSPGQQQTALTNFLLTQFLSERTAVFAGKLDTLDGDMNAFAHGRGKDQFLNTALVVNPITFRNVPYSTYGAGFLLLDGAEPWFSFMVIDPVDKSTEGPGELFAEGVTLAAELRLPTNFLGLPGHQLFGGTWSNRGVPDLSRLLVPPGTPLPTVSEAWSLYWNFDQHLFVDPSDPSRGWGVFGRAGVADNLSNPLDSFVSFGIGGSSPLAGREADTFGVGWFYAPVNDQLPGIFLGEYGEGVELYYNYSVSPWMHVTPDLQVVQPARRDVDTTLIFGLRVKLTL